MDPSVCHFLESFLITSGVVVCVGKREPTNPLCVTLLMPHGYRATGVGLLHGISCLLE